MAMDQLSALNLSNRQCNSSMSSWCPSLPGSLFGASSCLSPSQHTSVWPPFRNSDNSKLSAAKLLRLDSQGCDDYTMNFVHNAALNLDSGPSSEHHWLSFKSMCGSDLARKDCVWSHPTLCNKVISSSIKIPGQYQDAATSSLLSKVQSELCAEDTSFNSSNSHKTQLNSRFTNKALVDFEALSLALTCSDLHDKVEGSWQKGVPVYQQIVHQVGTTNTTAAAAANQSVTCQPRFLCRRKNLCSRFSDRKAKCIVSKRMSNLLKTTMLGSFDVWNRVKCDILPSTLCSTVDCCTSSTELDGIGASFCADVSVRHCENTENRCISQLPDISAFSVNPSELDSDEDSCNEDWNAIGSSSSSVAVCSVNVDHVQHMLLQDCLPASSESDIVYHAIKGAEDEVDGISRIDIHSCSRKYGFHLDVVNAKWNECYTISDAFGNQNGHLQRKQVGFCDEVSFVPILNGTEWADDYSAARCGLWKVDQLRFDHRISEVEQQIGWVFSEEHRVKWLAVNNGQFNQTSNTCF